MPNPKIKLPAQKQARTTAPSRPAHPATPPSATLQLPALSRQGLREPQKLTRENVMALQRTVGNRAVMRVLGKAQAVVQRDDDDDMGLDLLFDNQKYISNQKKEAFADKVGERARADVNLTTGSLVSGPSPVSGVLKDGSANPLNQNLSAKLNFGSLAEPAKDMAEIKKAIQDLDLLYAAADFQDKLKTATEIDKDGLDAAQKSWLAAKGALDLPGGANLVQVQKAKEAFLALDKKAGEIITRKEAMDNLKAAYTDKKFQTPVFKASKLAEVDIKARLETVKKAKEDALKAGSTLESIKDAIKAIADLTIYAEQIIARDQTRKEVYANAEKESDPEFFEKVKSANTAPVLTDEIVNLAKLAQAATKFIKDMTAGLKTLSNPAHIKTITEDYIQGLQSTWKKSKLDRLEQDCSLLIRNGYSKLVDYQGRLDPKERIKIFTDEVKNLVDAAITDPARQLGKQPAQKIVEDYTKNLTGNENRDSLVNNVNAAITAALEAQHKPTLSKWFRLLKIDDEIAKNGNLRIKQLEKINNTPLHFSLFIDQCQLPANGVHESVTDILNKLLPPNGAPFAPHVTLEHFGAINPASNPHYYLGDASGRRKAFPMASWPATEIEMGNRLNTEVNEKRQAITDFKARMGKDH
jgi:hypothetical protein